jgi:hypothetical protein
MSVLQRLLAGSLTVGTVRGPVIRMGNTEGSTTRSVRPERQAVEADRLIRYRQAVNECWHSAATNQRQPIR